VPRILWTTALSVHCYSQPHQRLLTEHAVTHCGERLWAKPTAAVFCCTEANGFSQSVRYSIDRTHYNVWHKIAWLLADGADAPHTAFTTLQGTHSAVACNAVNGLLSKQSKAIRCGGVAFE
jgi:hypothetical protein